MEFGGISDQEWWNSILPKLQGFESMTRAAIMGADGGKSQGTNSHPVKYENLSRNAQKRLKEIGHNDVSELFSLRLSETKRNYGIRDGRAFKLIWYDRDHGDATKAVCPSSKRQSKPYALLAKASTRLECASAPHSAFARHFGIM